MASSQGISPRLQKRDQLPFFSRRAQISIWLVTVPELRYYSLVRIFKNTWFAWFASKEGITDGELKEAVNQLDVGQADADLGGDVYKMRIARSGEGKSGGYRVIVFFKSEERTFFQYAFSKADRGNIDQQELQYYKRMAKMKLAMPDGELANALNAGELIEI